MRQILRGLMVVQTSLVPSCEYAPTAARFKSDFRLTSGGIRTRRGKLKAFSFGSATERTQPGTRWLLSRKKGRVSNGSESQSHSDRRVWVGSPGRREARPGEACAIGSGFDRSGERHSACANR